MAMMQTERPALTVVQEAAGPWPTTVASSSVPASIHPSIHSSVPSSRPAPDPERICVRIVAEDPVNRAGISAQLREVTGIRVVLDQDVFQRGELERGVHAARAIDVECHVAIVVGDVLDARLNDQVRRLRATGVSRVLLCAATIDESGLRAAAEAGACGLIRRAEATPERLVTAIRAASLGHTLPPRAVIARELRSSRLSERELNVLRLISEGFDTREIADELCYSERTVKNIIHDVTTRLQLRNRSHAVAFAMRQGLI